MRLSPHFTLAEMTASETAARRGIDNSPPAEAIAAMKALCVNVLEPLRAHYGAPVIITSGYRAPALNSAIGGSRSSQHPKGEAADFRVHGQRNIDVCRWMQSQLNYDQLIYEFGESGWVHVSWRARMLRNEELTAKRVRIGGRLRTQYLPGIVA